MENFNEIVITQDVIKEYYDCVRECACFNSWPMKDFKEKYPLQFKKLSAVHHKRLNINNNVDALRLLGCELYFGTLTFDEIKDRNKIACKRKEAFAYLNKLFDCVLLIEEEGEERNRYHIHFVGNFKKGKGFSDFVEGWHSRQNLRKLKDDEKISQYLCKYLAKSLPRVRRNKNLIELHYDYMRYKPLKRSFPCLWEKHVDSLHKTGSMKYNIYER